jgi:hypothetical protein
MINKARKGDTHAYKALMDSGYGAPIQQIEHDIAPDVQPIINIIQGNAPPQARDEIDNV